MIQFLIENQGLITALLLYGSGVIMTIHEAIS